MQQNLFIAGANGGIGRQAVEQALRAGYRVTALVRDPTKLTLTHSNLQIVTGDVLQLETFAHHLENKDAVISALGVSGGSLFNDKPTSLYSQGSANLMTAMKEFGIKRAFFISASALEISSVLPWYVRFAAKYVLQNLLKHMYADLRKMETLIKASETNWTIIRPPQLTDGPLTGKYRVAANQFLRNALKISRADVAHFILDNVNNQAIQQDTVEIAY